MFLEQDFTTAKPRPRGKKKKVRRGEMSTDRLGYDDPAHLGTFGSGPNWFDLWDRKELVAFIARSHGFFGLVGNHRVVPGRSSCRERGIIQDSLQ